jgi:hypothetical protein
MSDVLIPAKTSLGVQELRSRTHGLSQRHRTVLLLIDGNRPLGEVLHMAQQAGAQTTHFEELLGLGLIEMPARSPGYEAVETVPDLSIAPPTQPMELDTAAEEPAQIVEVEVPAVQPEMEVAAVTAVAAMTDITPAAAEADTGTETHPVQATPLKIPQPPQALAPSEVPAPIEQPPAAPAGPSASMRVRAQDLSLGLSINAQVPEWKGPERRQPKPRADHARPAARLTPEERLKIVRQMVIDVLRNDNILFATFSVVRVRNAQTQREMIDLIWEIERDRIHIRRSREQLNTLQRARELLGMGNTHVAGDSQPPPMPSDF